MRINPATLLFEDFTPQEGKEILACARAIVLDGKVPHPYPAWLDQWMQVAGFEADRRLLVISTAFPQRALLSLLKEAEREAPIDLSLTDKVTRVVLETPGIRPTDLIEQFPQNRLEVRRILEKMIDNGTFKVSIDFGLHTK